MYQEAGMRAAALKSQRPGPPQNKALKIKFTLPGAGYEPSPCGEAFSRKGWGGHSLTLAHTHSHTLSHSLTLSRTEQAQRTHAEAFSRKGWGGGSRSSLCRRAAARPASISINLSKMVKNGKKVKKVK